MPLLIDHDPAAHAVLLGVAVATIGAEVGATYLGQAREGRRDLWGSVTEGILLLRRRDEAASDDRWTKQVLIAGVIGGLLAAYLIAKDEPPLRAFANNWWTLAAGAVLALAGIALRAWAVWTLGRAFRREVAIQGNQPLVRRGPYRWLRHPAYAGNLLTFSGLGLGLGSWLSAAVLFALTFLAQIPRIRVEERTLEQAFGDEYVAFERSTARLIPGLW